MTPLFAAAFELQQFCQARDWRSYIMAGIALPRGGQPALRATWWAAGMLSDAYHGSSRRAQPPHRKSSSQQLLVLAGALQSDPLCIAARLTA